MSERARILLVEDDEPQRRTLAGFLAKRGFVVLEADGAEAAIAKSRDNSLDLLLTDLRLGGPDGIQLLEALRAEHPDLQALVLTAYGTVDDAVRAMKAGAYDFLAKPVDLDRLEALIHKALERVRLAEENRVLREVARGVPGMDSFVGESAAVLQVKVLAAKVAASRATALILGESGTGKEVLARAIHQLSPRRDKPFVSLVCAALPQGLIEAELFGHEKGAFTGAGMARPGRIERARGGTLFLDEIGDIPLELQVKLLQVLQSGEYERLGEGRPRQADVRIIAATHRDLEARVREGLFREDLYWRLNVVQIRVPPLRDRPGDIPLLAMAFLKKHGDLGPQRPEGISQAALEALKGRAFPGNVRELENMIERAIVLAEGKHLELLDFPAPEGMRPSAPGAPAATLTTASPGQELTLEEEVAALEVGRIRAALAEASMNQSAAARALGLSERAIRYKIKKYGL